MKFFVQVNIVAVTVVWCRCRCRCWPLFESEYFHTEKKWRKFEVVASERFLECELLWCVGNKSHQWPSEKKRTQ